MLSEAENWTAALTLGNSTTPLVAGNSSEDQLCVGYGRVCIRERKDVLHTAQELVASGVLEGAYRHDGANKIGRFLV